MQLEAAYVCACVSIYLTLYTFYTHTRRGKKDLEYLRVYLQAYSLPMVVDITAVR